MSQNDNPKPPRFGEQLELFPTSTVERAAAGAATACGYCPGTAVYGLSLNGAAICWGCWEELFLRCCRWCGGPNCAKGCRQNTTDTIFSKVDGALTRAEEKK